MLTDRIDPPPPKRIYRWDLDKTYLQTEFDTLRQLVRTAFQKASEKKAVPGAAALIRELKGPESRLCIVSGSPTQMRAVLAEKLKLDGQLLSALRRIRSGRHKPAAQPLSMRRKRKNAPPERHRSRCAATSR